MTLESLIQVITGNKNIVITVNDSNEDMLIKFYVGGQAVLAPAILARTVGTLKFENGNSIIVDLNPATT